MKAFAAINFSKYFISAGEKLYSKLSEEQNLRKVAESLHILLTTHNEIMQSNSSDNCVHHYNELS